MIFFLKYRFTSISTENEMMKVKIKTTNNDRKISNMLDLLSCFKFSGDKYVKKGTKKINNPINVADVLVARLIFFIRLVNFLAG